MGRGGQCILKDDPDAFHVKLYAPLDKRAKWIAEKNKINIKSARIKIEEIDKRRSNFIKHYYNEDIDDINLYHLLINIHKFSIEQAANIIADVVKANF